MAAKDIIHDAVKRALEKEDWNVNFDPYIINLGGGKKLKPDLGAEKVIMATNDFEQIVIEIKTFGLPSILNSFHEAFG